jgi:fructokinase
MKPAPAMNKPTPTPTPAPAAENAPVIACFGEIIWDCLPRGIFLGGAPLNVAYHLSRLGRVPRLISAVGRDFLGDEALRRLAVWGLDPAFVRRDRRATGTVVATLEEAGVARYTFAAAPAWDRITVSPSTLRRPAPPAAVVFGTLALREPANRKALQHLLDAWPAALRVVDINLRPPFDGMPAVRWSLARASLLKLNVEELSVLIGLRTETLSEIAQAVRRLARMHRLERICVTVGARGAGLLWDGDWHWVAARNVRVRDTVGAGDAFLAALLAGLLQGEVLPARALTAACRLGEFVATQDGATPNYRLSASGRVIRITR